MKQSARWLSHARTSPSPLPLFFATAHTSCDVRSHVLRLVFVRAPQHGVVTHTHTHPPVYYDTYTSVTSKEILFCRKQTNKQTNKQQQITREHQQKYERTIPSIHLTSPVHPSLLLSIFFPLPSLRGAQQYMCPVPTLGSIGFTTPHLPTHPPKKKGPPQSIPSSVAPVHNGLLPHSSSCVSWLESIYYSIYGAFFTSCFSFCLYRFVFVSFGSASPHFHPHPTPFAPPPPHLPFSPFTPSSPQPSLSRP